MNISKLTALFLSGALIFTVNSASFSTTTTPPAVATTTTKTEVSVPKESKVITVYYNGKVAKINLKPYLDKNKMIFLPLKEVATLTKATFTWNKDTGKATYKLGKTTVQFTIGKDTATVNGKSIKLKNKLVNSNGSIYGDLRTISDCLGLKTGYKLGYDKSNKNVFSHVVSITSSIYKGIDPLKSVGLNGNANNGSDGVSEKSIVDRGFENSIMKPEETAKWFDLYEKIPHSYMGNAPTQILNMANMYMMSMVPVTGDSFRPEIVINYEKEGLITIDINSLPNKWDYFFEKTLTHLMGADGTTIATRLNKEIWATYNDKENVYRLSTLKGNWKVGKFTVNYDKPQVEITWSIK